MSNISKDFVTKNGIIVKGTGIVTGLTSQTNALQVDGGAAIAKNIIVGSTATIYGVTTIANTANSFSTITGALVVQGGLGVAKNLYVGGTIFGTISGAVTTATSLSGGTIGSIPIQSAANQTAYIAPGTVNGYVLTWDQVNSTATWQSVSGGVTALANTATNIAAGSLGSIPYQTAPGLTAFIGTGTVGSLLQMGANTATFVNSSSVQVGFAANLLGGNTNTVPFQTAANATGFNNNFTFNGTILRVTEIAVTNTTSATNTTTGVLQVEGGVGVGDSVYVRRRVGFVNASNASAVYQIYNPSTNSLDTVFA